MKNLSLKTKDNLNIVTKTTTDRKRAEKTFSHSAYCEDWVFFYNRLIQRLQTKTYKKKKYFTTDSTSKFFAQTPFEIIFESGVSYCVVVFYQSHDRISHMYKHPCRMHTHKHKECWKNFLHCVVSSQFLFGVVAQVVATNFLFNLNCCHHLYKAGWWKRGERVGVKKQKTTNKHVI